MSNQPIDIGQWRQAWEGGPIWAVIEPGRRKGFWLVVTSDRSYDTWEEGRRILERMPIVPRSYFGEGKEHPGVAYRKMVEETAR